MYHWKDELNNLTTKELLVYLATARTYRWSFNPYYDSGYAPKWSHWFTIDEIKEVLSTRERIPNKIERRRIRQEKFKQKKNR